MGEHFKIDTPRKKTIKLIIIGCIGFIIAAGVFYAVALKWAHFKYTKVPFIYNWGYTTNTTPVIYEMSSHRFAVPVNYLYNRGEQRAGGKTIKTVGVNMEAFLPDMKGYSEEMKDDIKKLGWNYKISMGLRARERYYKVAELFKKYNCEYPIEEPPSPDDPPGLHRFTSKPINREQLRVDLPIGKRETGCVGYSDREVYAKIEGGNAVYFAWCEKGLPSSTLCNLTRLDYADDLYVEYTFLKKHLHQWKEIEDKLRGLIQSFEDEANKQENKETSK